MPRAWPAAACAATRMPMPRARCASCAARADGAAMLATDGVFSMDGDVAPLRELALVARVQKAMLYVDDAHGVGVLGPEGRGSVAAARLGIDDVPLQLVTLGKALGGYGAAVVGDDALIGHLSETARPYIYTTALPPAQAAASLAAVKLARREHWRRDKLGALIAHFRGAALRARPRAAAIGHADPAGDVRRRRARDWRWRRRWKRSATGSPRSVRRPCPKAARACASRCRRCIRMPRSMASSKRWPSRAIAPNAAAVRSPEVARESMYVETCT